MKSVKLLEKTFKALANKKRLDILYLLFKEKHMAVVDIAESIKLSQKSTSKHLFALYHAEFLDKERIRGLTIYRINDKLNDEGKFLIVLLRKFC